MKLPKSRIKTVLIIVAFGVILNWGLNNLPFFANALQLVWSILFPFILGFCVAFLLNIPMKAIEKLVFRGRLPRVRRPLSLVITLLLLVAVLVFGIRIVLPELISTIARLFSSIPTYFNNLTTMLEPYYEYLPQLEEALQSLGADWQKLIPRAMELMQTGGRALLLGILGAATNLVNGAITFFIGLIFAIYLLLDKERFVAQFKSLFMAYLPQDKYDRMFTVMQLVNRTFSQFVAGQCTEAVAITLFFLVVLSIGQFSYALLISVLIGFLSLIPILGAFIGCVVGAFLILVVQGFWRFVAFIIVFLVVQQIDGNFVYPHIIGKSISLPPVWVLVAVTVGGGLMGVFGMLFFIPLTSVIYTLVSQNAHKRLEEKGVVSPMTEVPEPPPRRKAQPTEKPAGDVADAPAAQPSETKNTPEAAAAPADNTTPAPKSETGSTKPKDGGET